MATGRDITERERRTKQLHRLSHRLLRVREEERKELSRELHDRLGQQLTALRLQLEALAEGREEDPAGRARELLDVVDRTIEQVQGLIGKLRKRTIDAGRLLPALREFARDRGEEAGFPIRVRADEVPAATADEVATACLAIAREVITNAIRHADPGRVDVELRRREDRLELVVEDDGRGFSRSDDPSRPPGGDGDLGLNGMLERALRVDGNLRVDTERDRGTRVRAVLPLSPP